jgi:Gpi18-like mannosyltransferase
MSKPISQMARKPYGTREGTKHWLASAPSYTYFVALLGLALALALRYSLIDYKSLDFYASLKPWYNTIKDQGFSAFATNFSTYNPPYLYLLYLLARFAPDLPVVWAVKLPALAADLVCAWIVALIVSRRYARSSMVPLVACLSVLFAPTAVLNSSFWGQADSLLTAGLLGSVYLLMTERPTLAMVSFGIALAFKLQAVFLAPVLLALALRGELPWRSFLAVPGMLVAAIVPAWLAGRPLGDLLNVYLYQTSQFEYITMNAASAYAWLPGSKQVFNQFYVPGIIMGVSAAFILCMLLWKGPNTLKPALLLEVSLLATIVVPFFLPKMHERYFYPADMLLITFIFFYPRYFYVSIAGVGASFLSYQPFLFERDLVPLPILTAVMLGLIGVLGWHTVHQLYGSDPDDGFGNPGAGKEVRGGPEDGEVAAR